MAVSLGNVTTATTTAAYKIYALNRDAVIGIVVGICGGIPLLVIFCLCIHACVSKSKRPVGDAGATLHTEPLKGTLMQKFCDVKDKTLNHFKKSTKADNDEDNYKRKRSVVLAARKSTPSEMTPVTAFSEDESGSKKKKSKNKAKKGKKDEDKQVEKESKEKKKDKKEKKKKNMNDGSGDEQDWKEAKTSKKKNKQKKKSAKSVDI